MISDLLVTVSPRRFTQFFYRLNYTQIFLAITSLKSQDTDNYRQVFDGLSTIAYNENQGNVNFY